jgi:tetratricopeptide (TPR) repeat protein
LFREIGDRYFTIVAISNLGHLQRRRGDLDSALESYRKTIQVWRDQGQRAAVAHQLESFAFVAIAMAARDQGEDAEAELLRAARLLGAAEALREVIESSMTPAEWEEYNEQISALSDMLEGEALDDAWREGRGRSMEEAIAEALQVGAPSDD